MPTLGVNVAIFQDSEVLLIQRSDLPVWALPGGGVDNGESVAQAATREALEETGLEVALTRLVGICSRPDWRRGGDRVSLWCQRRRRSPADGYKRDDRRHVTSTWIICPNNSRGITTSALLTPTDRRPALYGGKI